MYTIVEITEYDRSITNRISPFFDIHSVHATHQGAIRALYRIKKGYDEYNVESWIIDKTLVIKCVPWRALTKISYKIELVTLYGTHINDKTVYHLMGFNGYMNDQDKPYRYDNLGWFTSPYVARGTKEWQILKHILISRDDISGYETELEIKINNPYDCTDQNPSLVLRPYRLYK